MYIQRFSPCEKLILLDDGFYHCVLTFKGGRTLIGLMGTIKGQRFTFYNSQDEVSFC